MSAMNPVTLWITGKPGSGKSTIAEGVKKIYPDFIILRMDELRKIVTPEPTYAESERDIVYRCMVYTAKILSGLGHSVIIDATGNLRKWRDFARQVLPDYGEIYLRCPAEFCVEREAGRANTHGAPKGIYEKGKAGWPVPGVTVPYEEPRDPELVIDTDKVSVPDALEAIRELICRLQRQEPGPCQDRGDRQAP